MEKGSQAKHQTAGSRGLGMILPVFKLGTLALRTLCKPIGNRIKKEAGLHPRFRQSIINIAQANHRLTTNLQRRIYGRATDVVIRPLNEEKAVQAAADLMGELFIFTDFHAIDRAHKLDKVAGVALVFEVQRSSRTEAKKEEMRKHEIEVLKQRDEELSRELEQLRHRILEVEQLAKEQGLSSIFNLRHSKETDNKTKDAPSS